MQDNLSETNRETRDAWGGASMGGDLKDSARDVARDAKGTVTEIAGKAKDQVMSQVATQKERAVTSLDDVTQTLHETGRQLQEKGQDTAGSLMDSVASQIESLTGYLKGRDVDDLLVDLQDMARRNPTLFVGGAFVLGVAAARFLKSSSPYSTPRYNRDFHPSETSHATVGTTGTAATSAYTGGTGALYATPAASAAEATGTYGTTASAAGRAPDSDTWTDASDRITVTGDDLEAALEEEEETAFGTSRSEAI